MPTPAKRATKRIGATVVFLLLLFPLAARWHRARAQSETPPAPALEGLWLSDGYGLLLEIDADAMQAFEVKSVSCIPAWHAARKTSAPGDAAILFEREEDTLRLTPSVTADVARLHDDSSVSDILLVRAAGRPRACQEKLKDTPQTNYAVFWQTFAENYPFFSLRNVDWPAVNAKYRPEVTSKTSPEELFRILHEMIEPLHDAHTFLVAPRIKQRYEGYRPDPNKLDDNDWKKVSEIVESNYVRGGLRSFCKGKVRFGTLPGAVGYLRVSSFAGYADHPGFPSESQALDAALDAIFHDSQKLKGLVIDVRYNTGGYDGLGVIIAARLTRQKYLAYSKQTRNNPTGPVRFTSPQSVWVTPSTHPGFQGNVVLLIGRDCVSAGETFTMALLGRKPAVTRVGENTQGVYSDILARKLPNGWGFGLPNEVYLAEDGKAFDGSGVPPDISVPVFPRSDLQSGRDSVLEKALDLLKNPGKP